MRQQSSTVRLLNGAGFIFLLVFMLLTTLAPSVRDAWLQWVDAIVDSHDIAVPVLSLLGSLGAAIYALRLFSFSRVWSQYSERPGLTAISAAAVGLGIMGSFAWLYWSVSEGSEVDRMLVWLTLLGAAVSWGLSILLDRLEEHESPDEALTHKEVTGSAKDYLLLTKPIVLALLLVTTLAAMIVAAGAMPRLDLLLWTMIGGAFSGGGASALNQYIDRFRDGKMARTKRRPLPEGRLQPQNVVIFGTLLCIAGFYTLAIFVNLLSAFLALAGMIYYVFFYSLVLKPTTTQNIVIGGGAGAIPPLVGWGAATGEISMPAFFLFALVFFWTPPHFWALALLKRRDYKRAGVPMLPVVYGSQETRWQIMLYTIQVVALTLLLPLAELGGQLYFAAALLLGCGLVFYAWQLWKDGGNLPAYKMYRYSSTYLALIFAALVVDTLI